MAAPGSAPAGHVLFLAHDLGDAAVRRRVAMLQAGGARVSLAGFRRGVEPVASVGGVPAIDLGRTRDGAFARRMASVALAAARLGTKLGALKPDVVLARNLEMLALANRVRRPEGTRPRIVYECLDIHRLMLRQDPAGAAMRGLERALMRRAGLLVTSSPAFLRDYFRPVQGAALPPVRLVENKVLDLTGAPPARPAPPARDGRPLTIGWFGALRCAKSLALLAETARLMEGRIEVVLRGRPAAREFADFDGAVARAPHLRFEGPYRSPEDLSGIYGGVDLVWAIDFFEEGLNSRWLLPNRLYEGCRHGRVPLAMAGTETARFLAGHGIGAVLERAEPEALRDLLLPFLDGGRLAAAEAAVAAVEPGAFTCGRAECEALVEAILRPGTSGARVPDMEPEAAAA